MLSAVRDERQLPHSPIGEVFTQVLVVQVLAVPAVPLPLLMSRASSTPLLCRVFCLNVLFTLAGAPISQKLKPGSSTRMPSRPFALAVFSSTRLPVEPWHNWKPWRVLPVTVFRARCALLISRRMIPAPRLLLTVFFCTSVPEPN